MPAADALLTGHGATKICDYIAHLGQHKVAEFQNGFQDHTDFIAEIGSYTQETLGSEIAEAIVEDLREIPQVLTVNHHGIDTFAQSTQSNLMFSMRKRADGSSMKTVPVLACGSIPLNNLTYPRGLLIYATSEESEDNGICKLPLFPDSYKRKLVNVAQPFTTEMLYRSRIRANKLIVDKKIAPSLESALNMVFDDFANIGQDFPDYSSQATVANHHIWRRLFRNRLHHSELVYIDMENIAGRLLRKDLFEKSTICYQLMFDPELRRRLIENLDGQRGCWQYDELMRRCSGTADGLSETGPAGTMFFWGVDAKGRQIPLCVMDGQNEEGTELRGIDGNGQDWTIPFTPAGIAQALQDGSLLPSIFTSYLLIAIARGISCIGGYYQADYLPVMQKAVIDTLHGKFADTVKTDITKKLCPDLYLSGMQAVGIKNKGQVRPAGPLEIIASGGFTEDQYEQIGEITVLQSHIASLYDTITDIAPDSSDLNWGKNEISKLVHDAVGDKIVTISME